MTVDRRDFLRAIAAVAVLPREVLAGAADRTYAIHPALGVARLGNAEADLADPSSYYLGPESPYQVPNAGQPYKIGGKIKKQAQRFRIYEFEDGQATREITLQEEDVAAIEWTVHLSNRKAALDTGLPGTLSTPGVIPSSYWPAETRNDRVPPAERGGLLIDPGRQSVGAAVSQQVLSGNITFRTASNEPRTKAVTLGELRTEPTTGRLLVFAGDGISEGLLDGNFSRLAALDDWRNNDDWYDDSADGWVRAKITFRDGRQVTLDQPDQSAWVICTVPRYAPGINYFTTLYDVSRSTFYTPGQDPGRPSFAEDIYPILRSASLLQWVGALGSLGHGVAAPGYFLAADRMRLLSDNDSDPDSPAYKARHAVFGRIRDPARVGEFASEASHNMPQLPLEVIEEPEKEPWDISAVTPLQYALLRKWADGDFDSDGVPEYVPLDELDVTRQPSALDRAAVEMTAGTPFYPGIESWRIARERALYASAPLRFSSRVRPGDLTMGNALPWQADFLDCIDAWWPVQRPYRVMRGGQPERPWVPPEWKESADTPEFTQMVQHWARLGLIVSLDGGATYVEVEGDAEEAGA